MSVAEQVIERLLSNTYGKNDCYKRLSLLEEVLARSLYSTAENASDRAGILARRLDSSEDRESATALAAWGPDVLSAFNADGLRDEIEEIKRAIERLPVLVLYAPVSFSGAHVAAIGGWCRTHVDPRVLLEFRIDRDAAGGCLLVWKSVFYDFSLRYFLRKHYPEVRDVVEALVRAPEHTIAP